MNSPTLAPVPYETILEAARDYVSDDLENVHRLMGEVAEQAPGKLALHLGQLLTRRGKRIRSTFLLLLARSNQDASRDRAIRACAAVELIHQASLIHDDIIDGSEVRRNEQAAHRRWGNRMAVLLGDYMMAKAMELIWSDPDPRVPLSLSKASARLIRAEVAEIDQSGNLELTKDAYFDIIEGKTAALLEACGECAAVVAGYDIERVKQCAELGRHFGVSFQIIDDLLDFGFGAVNLDKRTFSDVKNGLLTLPLILFRDAATSADKAALPALIAAAKDNAGQQILQAKMAEAGVFEQARQIALSRVDACMPVLNALPKGISTNHLLQVCRLMIDRSA